MVRNAEIRCSDADRDATAAALRQHLADGRITVDEFGERLDRAFAARTYGDLAAVMVDLPRTPSVPTGSSSSWTGWTGRPRRRRQRWSRFVWVNAVCWTVWAASGAHGFPWPVLATVPWGGWRVTRAAELRHSPRF